jgi:hypothetical protein
VDEEQRRITCRSWLSQSPELAVRRAPRVGGPPARRRRLGPTTEHRTARARIARLDSGALVSPRTCQAATPLMVTPARACRLSNGARHAWFPASRGRICQRGCYFSACSGTLCALCIRLDRSDGSLLPSRASTRARPGRYRRVGDFRIRHRAATSALGPRWLLSGA